MSLKITAEQIACSRQRLRRSFALGWLSSQLGFASCIAEIEGGTLKAERTLFRKSPRNSSESP
jgi:hypothetical protein